MRLESVVAFRRPEVFLSIFALVFMRSLGVELVKQQILGIGLEGFESFNLFRKGFASPSSKISDSNPDSDSNPSKKISFSKEKCPL